jgi:predicted phosphodiesterase
MRRRIAVITDAHAYLPALGAALTAIRADGPDAVYHTGDAIGIGPFPAETLDRLLHESGLHH